MLCMIPVVIAQVISNGISLKHRWSNFVLTNNALVDLHAACITGRGAADDQTPAAAGSGRPFQPRRGSPATPGSTKQHDDTKNVIHSSEMTRSVTIHLLVACQVDLQRQGRRSARPAPQRRPAQRAISIEWNRAFFDRCTDHAIFR